MSNSLLTYILISVIATLLIISAVYITLYYHNKYGLGPFAKKKVLPLSHYELAEIFNFTDSRINSTNSLYPSTELCIDGTTITEQAINEEYHRYKDSTDNGVIKKHIQYLQAHTTNSSDDSYLYVMRRATLGAALEHIFTQNTKKVPDISLIHHMLSYIYSRNSMNLLYKLLNNTLEKNSKYQINYSMFHPKIQLRYISTTESDQFLINIVLEGTLTSKKNSKLSIPLNADIQFLISLPDNNNQALKYSSGTMHIHTSRNQYVK